MDERERVELASGELLVHFLSADGRAPRDLKPFGLFATALADIEPLVGERAAHAVENFLRDEIADGAFHHAPGGRSAEIDELFGGEQRLKLRLHPRVEVLEALAAVADHWRSERLKGLFADFNRTGDVQFHVCHNSKIRAQNFSQAADRGKCRFDGSDEAHLELSMRGQVGIGR